jgi:hypothetical protein
MFIKPISKVAGMVAALALVLPFSVMAAESFELTVRDHRFEPTSLTVPAGVKVKLVIKNLDDTPEEFESYSLHREKLIPGGGQITVYVGPLEPGSYDFFGEFHSDTAKGQLIAK